MYKTCKDLEDSLYIAPNEIRACCKRFFYNDKMRGDAKLLDIIDGKTPTAEDLIKGRQKLFDEIQDDKNDQCLGCPFLKKVSKKPKISNQIKRLSIEHHSVCNLRCNYCSEIYYGGKRSKYNVVEFVKYLNNSGSFQNCNQVVWGGGEPTLDKSFELILEEINNNANPNIYHRVFTNAVRYSEAITNFLKKGLVKITTSVDAGTPETFNKVRGRPRFLNVFENLKRYSQINPKHVIIKYIFTDENSDENELIKFVDNCLLYNLDKCNFQISLNFKKEKLDLKILKRVSFLFSILKMNNINKVFVDDHIAMRFMSLNIEETKELEKYLLEHKFKNIILNANEIEDLVLYGAGNIAQELVRKTSFFKNLRNFDIVDSDEEKIGNTFFKKKILSKEILKNDKRKVFIASALFYDEIYDNIVQIKGNENNIITGLIV